MNKLFYFFSLGMVLMTLNLFSDTESEDKIFPYPIHKETLENGLNVYVIPMESNGLASYWTIVRTGSRDEVEKGKTGFAHFFEHMMFRGTKKYPQDVYDSIVVSLGADANAYTTDDYTAYHLNIAAEDIETVMDIESERFQNLSYAEPEFKTEAGAVYGEYRKNITNPISVLFEKLQETAYKKHTYSHTTMGYIEDILNMPNMYDYSKEFYNRFYRPENCILVIVGDVDPEKTFESVSNYFGSWEQGYQKPNIPSEPEQTQERRADVNYDGRTNPWMVLAYKGLPYDYKSKEVMADQLFASLAFGSNSELYQKLYLEEQKVIAFGSSIPNNRDQGLNLIYAQLKDKTDFSYLEEEIGKTIEKYQTQAVEIEKLNDLKKRIKYSFLMSLNSPDEVASGLANFVAVTGGLEGLETEFETMEKVTPEDIMEAAKRFVSEKRTIVRLTGVE